LIEEQMLVRRCTISSKNMRKEVSTPPSPRRLALMKTKKWHREGTTTTKAPNFSEEKTT
jgi:hypothetical protein